eukprot:195181-Amphidinium_carterae.1
MVRPAVVASSSVLVFWRHLADRSPTTPLAQQLHHCETERVRERGIAMVLAGKSFAILRKRRSSLEKWAKCSSNDLQVPFLKNVFFGHMCELSRTNAPATRAQSLLEAVRFAHGKPGVPLADICVFTRLAGEVTDQLSSKRETRQWSPLSVAQSIALVL